jgi:hypothetical protein
MTRIIELVEKNVVGDQVHLIAECNLFDDNGKLYTQQSRSPFTYQASMTDEDIKLDLQNGAYSIYFN